MRYFGYITMILFLCIVMLLNKVELKTIKATPTMGGTEWIVPELKVEAKNDLHIEKVPVAQPCKVTWYGNEFHGRLSANGDVFDEYGMTAASNTLPFGTRVLIMYQGRSVEVTITDRGGFTHCFDLSKGAFEKLAPLGTGILYVEYIIL